jgi:hypothetical protein
MKNDLLSPIVIKPQSTIRASMRGGSEIIYFIFLYNENEYYAVTDYIQDLTSIKINIFLDTEHNISGAVTGRFYGSSKTRSLDFLEEPWIRF